MTVSGPQALQALDEALRDIRREEDDILRKLARGTERLAKIRDSEGDLLRQYAHGRLDAGREAELAARIQDAASTTRATLKTRGAEMSAGARRLDELDSELARLVAERADALGRIDTQQTILRGLSSRISAAIARDPDYAEAQQVAGRLNAVAAAARARARQADMDRELNGRPYRADVLFTYLARRDYGTDIYKAGALARRLDGWVARLTGYATAERHYRLLNELPARLHAHAEQQAARAAGADEAIDEIERGAIDAAGGGAVRAELTAAQQQIAAIDRQLLAIQDERDGATGLQTLLTTADDPAFDRAIDALAQALGSPDLPALILAARLARRGPEDPLLAQLDNARQRVGEEAIDAWDQHARLRTLATRRRELEDIEYEFKALRFDDPRSLFGDDQLAATQLNSFVTGTITAANYWEVFRRSQTWNVGTSDWGGGIGLPRHGRQGGAGRDAESFTRPRITSEDA